MAQAFEHSNLVNAAFFTAGFAIQIANLGFDGPQLWGLGESYGTALWVSTLAVVTVGTLSILLLKRQSASFQAIAVLNVVALLLRVCTGLADILNVYSWHLLLGLIYFIAVVAVALGATFAIMTLGTPPALAPGVFDFLPDFDFARPSGKVSAVFSTVHSGGAAAKEKVAAAPPKDFVEGDVSTSKQESENTNADAGTTDGGGARMGLGLGLGFNSGMATAEIMESIRRKQHAERTSNKNYSRDSNTNNDTSTSSGARRRARSRSRTQERALASGKSAAEINATTEWLRSTRRGANQ